MAGAAAKGLAVLGKKFAPKLLKLLGKSVGSAIAGSAFNGVANKLFGSGRRRRRRRWRRRRVSRGAGLRLFRAPGLVRRPPPKDVLQTLSSSSHGGARRRRKHRRRGGGRRRRYYHRYHRRY